MRCLRYGVQCSGYSTPASNTTSIVPVTLMQTPESVTADSQPQHAHESPQLATPSPLPGPTTSSADGNTPRQSQADTDIFTPVSHDREWNNHNVASSVSSQPYDTLHQHQPQPQQTATHHPQTHLELLRLPSAQKRLIHHWVTYTSVKLVLVDEPHNPCRTLMLPMALKGLMSTATASTADIATFHAICACAAYNLHNLGTSPDDNTTTKEWHSLALTHDQAAISHLRHNLSTADTHHDQSSAMAIMACITIEAISGSAGGRWRTHVVGGLAYLRRLRARGDVAVSEDVFAAFQAHLVSMAILCGFGGGGGQAAKTEALEDDLKGFLQEDIREGAVGERLELRFPYYGASRGFLRRLDRMNSLAAITSAAITTATRTNDARLGELLPPEAAHELSALELQLYLDFPPSLGIAAGPNPNATGALSPTHALMLHHMAQAFYYASLVFCQRCVRRQPLSSVQTLVDIGVRQLEAIETVSGGTAGSVMMWPALVLGAECAGEGRRGRMRRWLEGKMKLGFKNVAMLKALIETVWATRDAAGCDRAETAGGENERVLPGWQGLICEPRFDVFRL